MLEDLAHAHELVVELAAQRRDVFLLLEVGEDTVGQEQARAACRDRDAERGQVVQLTEHPCECRLAALVGAGDDEDPFAAGEAEVVGDDRGSLGNELAGERDVEAALDGAVLAGFGDRRVAERESVPGQACLVFEVGEVELRFAVEAGDALVDETAVPGTELLEGAERRWVKTGEQPGDPRLDVIHRSRVERPSSGGSPPSRSRKRAKVSSTSSGVVGFVVVAADGDAAALDPKRVPHLIERMRGPHRCRRRAARKRFGPVWAVR